MRVKGMACTIGTLSRGAAPVTGVCQLHTMYKICNAEDAEVAEGY